MAGQARSIIKYFNFFEKILIEYQLFVEFATNQHIFINRTKITKIHTLIVKTITFETRQKFFKKSIIILSLITSVLHFKFFIFLEKPFQFSKCLTQKAAYQTPSYSHRPWRSGSSLFQSQFDYLLKVMCFPFIIELNMTLKTDFKSIWQQIVINNHISASILNTEVVCIAVLRIQFEILKISQLKEIEDLDLEKCLEVVTLYRYNPKHRIVLLLLACELPKNLNGKIMKRGIKIIFQIFTLKHLMTDVDSVCAFVDTSVDKFQDKLVSYLKIEKLGAVLHGTILELLEKEKDNSGFTLITGGARGIGRETAIQLAQLGRRIIITSRNVTEAVIGFSEHLKKEYNVEAISLPLDLQNQQSCEALAATIKSMGLILSSVVHNGAVGSKTCIEQASNSTPEQALIGVNTIGPVTLHQQLVKEGVLASDCTITIVSSVGAVRVFYEMNRIDVASKGMLEPWIEELYQDGWNVNVVYPGATDTDMLRESTLNKFKQLNLYDEFCSKLPKGLVIPPQLIGRTICLAQDFVHSDRTHKNRVMANCGAFIEYSPLPQVGTAQNLKHSKPLYTDKAQKGATIERK